MSNKYDTTVTVIDKETRQSREYVVRKTAKVEYVRRLAERTLSKGKAASYVLHLADDQESLCSEDQTMSKISGKDGVVTFLAETAKSAHGLVRPDGWDIDGVDLDKVTTVGGLGTSYLVVIEKRPIHRLIVPDEQRFDTLDYCDSCFSYSKNVACLIESFTHRVMEERPHEVVDVIKEWAQVIREFGQGM